MHEAVVREDRSVDDDDGQAELDGRRDLRVRTTDRAAVLRHNDVRPVLAEHLPIERLREWPLHGDDLLRRKTKTLTERDDFGRRQHARDQRAVREGRRLGELPQVAAARRQEDDPSAPRRRFSRLLVRVDEAYRRTPRILELCQRPLVAQIRDGERTAGRHCIL